MATDFEIGLIKKSHLEHNFVKEVLSGIQSKPVTRSELGSYSIIGDPPQEDRIYMGPDGKDDTLEEILTWYTERDPTKTSLSIWFEYNEEFDFSLSFLSSTESDTRFRVFSDTTKVKSEQQFLTLVDLAADLFCQFSFDYGAYTNEYSRSIPANWEEIAAHHPQMVTLYSKKIIDHIGRQKLLKTPALEVRELQNGSILLIVCSDPMGGCPELEIAKNHIKG